MKSHQTMIKPPLIPFKHLLNHHQTIIKPPYTTIKSSTASKVTRCRRSCRTSRKPHLFVQPGRYGRDSRSGLRLTEPSGTTCMSHETQTHCGWKKSPVDLWYTYIYIYTHTYCCVFSKRVQILAKARCSSWANHAPESYPQSCPESYPRIIPQKNHDYERFFLDCSGLHWPQQS